MNPKVNERPLEGHVVGEAVNEDFDLPSGQCVLGCSTHPSTVPARRDLCKRGSRIQERRGLVTETAPLSLVATAR
jgi:hypothetical protein